MVPQIFARPRNQCGRAHRVVFRAPRNPIPVGPDLRSQHGRYSASHNFGYSVISINLIPSITWRSAGTPSTATFEVQRQLGSDLHGDHSIETIPANTLFRLEHLPVNLRSFVPISIALHNPHWFLR